jgi:hypothetical protein
MVEHQPHPPTEPNWKPIIFFGSVAVVLIMSILGSVSLLRD